MKPLAFVPLSFAAASFAALASFQAYATPPTSIKFPLTVSPGAKNCLPHAQGTVVVHTYTQVENMEVVVWGLPPKTDFVLFNIQVPNAPFGLGWYLGDILTDATGVGVTNVVGRFNMGTFIVSPGVADVPDVFQGGPFPEAKTGVKTAPINIYHLGVWFNDHNDALTAGCPGTETPFTSNHDAGIQVLNTATFPNKAGPLVNLQ
jgi:hypothetical protein